MVKVRYKADLTTFKSVLHVLILFSGVIPGA